MLNVRVSRPSSSQFVKLDALSFAERVIYWVIVLTPLWWISGIQTLFYPAIAIFLLIISFDIDKVVRSSLPACVWAWFVMSLVMLGTATIGISNLGFEISKIASTAITFFKSYFLIFTCLLLPFWNPIRVQVITRAVAWMTTGYLATIVIEMVMLMAGVGTEAFLPPLARLIPSNQDTLQIVFASIQPFFGIPLPRTVLYTPDPPIVGTCAILCFFICLGEKNSRLRKFALGGCLVALLISFSRLAWVCLPLSIIILACFRSRLARQGSLWIGSFTALLCSIFGMTFNDLLNKPLEVFNSARASSSTDREFVNRKTLEAWQESLWIGWGIINETVKWYNYELPLGSFSTYVSVLYLHGLIGFIFFLTALASMLWSFWVLAVRGNSLGKRAFASLLALYMMLNANPLSWTAVYFWFFFIWLGAILFEAQQHHKSVSSWEQLSR